MFMSSSNSNCIGSFPVVHIYFSLKRVDNSILTNKGKSRVAIQILKDYARYFCRICVNLLYSILILDKDFASFKSKEETT